MANVHTAVDEMTVIVFNFEYRYCLQSEKNTCHRLIQLVLFISNVNIIQYLIKITVTKAESEDSSDDDDGDDISMINES